MQLIVISGCSDGRSIDPASRPDLESLSTTRILVHQANRSIVARPDGSSPTALPLADWMWSPDGTQLAGAVGGQLMVTDAQTGDSKSLGAASAGAWGWSPQGDRVLLADLTVVDTQTGTRTIPGDGVAAGWSPDGRHLAVRRPATIEDDSLFVLDLQTGTSEFISTGTFAVQPFSPDGQRLLFALGGDGSGIPVVYDMTARTMVRNPAGATAFFTNALQWASDDLVLWDANGPEVHLWNLATHQASRLGGGIFPLASPLGRWVLFRADEGILPRVSIVAIDGGAVFDAGRGVDYSWSPDGMWIAMEQPPWIYLRSVSDAGEEHQLMEGRSPRWSPVR